MPTEYFNHTEAVVIIYSLYTPYSVYTIGVFTSTGVTGYKGIRVTFLHLNMYIRGIAATTAAFRATGNLNIAATTAAFRAIGNLLIPFMRVTNLVTRHLATLRES